MSERTIEVPARSPDDRILVIELPEDFTAREKEHARIAADRIAHAWALGVDPQPVVMPAQIKVYWAPDPSMEKVRAVVREEIGKANAAMVRELRTV